MLSTSVAASTVMPAGTAPSLHVTSPLNFVAVNVTLRNAPSVTSTDFADASSSITGSTTGLLRTSTSSVACFSPVASYSFRPATSTQVTEPNNDIKNVNPAGRVPLTCQSTSPLNFVAVSVASRNVPAVTTTDTLSGLTSISGLSGTATTFTVMGTST